MMLPGGACVPAVHAERRRLAEQTGVRAVAMAAERLTPGKILTPAAFVKEMSDRFEAVVDGPRSDRGGRPSRVRRRHRCGFPAAARQLV